MRDVLGPLRPVRRTAILPFQYRRLARASRVVVESCPASTLKRLGLPHQNYKQPAGGRLMRKRRRTRHAILAGVGAWRCWREYDHAAIGRHPRYSREGRQYA